MSYPTENLVNPQNVVANDNKALATGPYKHLYVGVGGDVTVVTLGGTSTTPEVTTVFKNVKECFVIWDANAAYVKVTGTTATDLVGWNPGNGD